MKNILREFLTFNKRERNGVFILVSIIFAMVLYLNVSSNFLNQEKVDFTKFNAEAEEIVSAQKKKPELQMSSIADQPDLSEGRTGRFDAERFVFDPNHLSDREWQRLGLSSKQISVIRKYESKGGKFRRKEDLKKMYCIKDEQYKSLEPYIEIGPSQKWDPLEQAVIAEKEDVQDQSAPKLERTLIELNSADSALLTTIKGIGGFFAKNIIKHRNSIGGFISKEQLLEVWKFDEEKLKSIDKFITIDPNLIKKININTCEASQLKNDYITWTLANGIVNYRKNHGFFKAVDEIRSTDLVDEETYRKIAPYLVIE